MKPKRALIINPKDNVATLIEDAEAGEQVAATLEREARTVKAVERIPFEFNSIGGKSPDFRLGMKAATLISCLGYSISLVA